MSGEILTQPQDIFEPQPVEASLPFAGDVGGEMIDLDAYRQLREQPSPLHEQLTREAERLRAGLDLVLQVERPAEEIKVDPRVAVLQSELAGYEAKQEAFGSIYEEFSREILGYVIQRLGSIPKAEDLTQDVFLKVWNKIDSFESRPNVPLKSWVYRIAHNHVIDTTRYMKNHKFTPVDFHDDWATIDNSQVIFWTALADDPVEHLIRKENLEDAKTILSEMKPEHREVLLLNSDGRSKAEICEELGLSLAAVKALLFRARKSYERHLNGTARKKRDTSKPRKKPPHQLSENPVKS